MALGFAALALAGFTTLPGQGTSKATITMSDQAA